MKNYKLHLRFKNLIVRMLICVRSSYELFPYLWLVENVTMLNDENICMIDYIEDYVNVWVDAELLTRHIFPIELINKHGVQCSQLLSIVLALFYIFLS